MIIYEVHGMYVEKCKIRILSMIIIGGHCGIVVVCVEQLSRCPWIVGEVNVMITDEVTCLYDVGEMVVGDWRRGCCWREDC